MNDTVGQSKKIDNKPAVFLIDKNYQKLLDQISKTSTALFKDRGCNDHIHLWNFCRPETSQLEDFKRNLKALNTSYSTVSKIGSDGIRKPTIVSQLIKATCLTKGYKTLDEFIERYVIETTGTEIKAFSGFKELIGTIKQKYPSPEEKTSSSTTSTEVKEERPDHSTNYRFRLAQDIIESPIFACTIENIDFNEIDLVELAKIAPAVIHHVEEKDEQTIRKVVAALILEAESGNPIAQERLAWCYRNSISVKKDMRNAVTCYQHAADGGFHEAVYELGIFYKYGLFTEHNPVKALELFNRAAKQGNLDALNQKGECLEHGIGTSIDEQHAYHCYLSAANLGHRKAMNNVGECLQYGVGIVPDSKEAVKWYIKSANRSHPPAMHNLSACYESGIGTNQNKENARMWREKAKKAGAEILNPNFNLQLYRYIDKSHHESIFLKTRKAAMDGNTRAMNEIGYLYNNGIGTAKDEIIGTEWYIKAAELGDTMAMYNVAACYEYGTGVATNKNEAFNWYLRASKRGNTKAMREVSIFYENGAGVSQNKEKADEWWNKAADAGDLLAKRALIFRPKK